MTETFDEDSWEIGCTTDTGIDLQQCFVALIRSMNSMKRDIHTMAVSVEYISRVLETHEEKRAIGEYSSESSF